MGKRIGIADFLLLLLLSFSVVAPSVPWGRVRINEVCWGGSGERPSAEWIELVNTTSDPIDLTGWRLVSSDGAPDVRLVGTLVPLSKPHSQEGYYLLERGSDDAVEGIAADLLYDGALNDGGERLLLYDADDRLIDTANAGWESADGIGWPAGTNAYGLPPSCSMERVDYRSDDTPVNWVTYAPPLEDDAPASFVSGTPRAENRAFNVPPAGHLRVDPPSPQPGRPARFDASLSDDPNDEITQYAWSFGDGETAVTSTQTVSHTYSQPGQFVASLMLHDAKGAVTHVDQVLNVRASHPPIADFSLRSDAGRRVLSSLDPILFQDESSDEEGQLLAWDWDFGDGSSSTERSPTHAYERPGIFEVTLRVADSQGDQGIRTQSTTIANLPPVAAFAVDTVSPNEDATVTFDATTSFDADGVVSEYRWDFDGDGTVDETSADPVVHYAYEKGGLMAAALCVTDDLGAPSLPERIDMDVNHAPVAQFSLSSFEVDELETVQVTDCSHDLDGTLAEWIWSFGDGAMLQGQTASHTYVASGTFPISLTVVDEKGAAGTLSVEVSVANLPPIALLNSDSPQRQTHVALTLDASASRDPSPSGHIVHYEWDFEGDGTFDEQTTAPTTRHAYANDGTFRPRVRATDNLGAATVSAPIEVAITNRAPEVAGITWEPNRPTDSDSVSFRAAASDLDGTVSEWRWTFGDGNASVESDPMHSFSEDGTFTVRLAVVDDDGAFSTPAAVSVLVQNAAPVALFNATSSDECRGAVALDARDSYDPSPTGRIAHFAWDFGDGTTCPGPLEDCRPLEHERPLHCYSTPGTYIVTLTVIDDQGAIGRTSREIDVSK